MRLCGYLALKPFVPVRRCSSRQGQGGGILVRPRGDPPGCLTAGLSACLSPAGELTRKRRGLVTIRWALWFSLVLVLVFAVTIGYHLGMEYAEQLLER